jgi:hypothetical protein
MQKAVDHLLLYFPGHIAIGAEWDKPALNGMTFEYKGKTYAIIETTIPGFQIGHTMMQNPSQIEMVQAPGNNSKIYHADTDKEASFVK